jgi:beta-phosphoglucomutase
MEPTSQFGVIFDLDGVLVDSYQMHYECWRSIAEEYSRRVTQKKFDSLFGRRGRDIVRQIWGSDLSDEQVTSIHKRKQALYRESLQAHFPAMDGAPELIDALVGAGFVLAIGSSAPRENIEMSLKGLGRENSFKAMVSGSEVTRGKPDPQVFQVAAQRLGVKPSHCAVIEDAPAGIAAAVAGGMTAIALSGTASAERLTEAHLVVTSLRQLTPQRIVDLIRK